jgi:hypothetical protein
MLTAGSSATHATAGEAQLAPPGATPRAFERARLWEALRAERRLLLVALLLGLFGGALVSRLSVPLDHRARAEARVHAEDPTLAASRVLDERVLEAARTLAGSSDSVGALRSRLEVEVRPPRGLVVTAHAPDAAGAARLADATVAAFVARESARVEARLWALRREHEQQVAAAQAELDRASLARATALADEGVADPAAELAAARQRSTELDAQIAEAHARASEASARRAVFDAQGQGESSQRAGAELAEAQRALSLLLATRGSDDPEVQAERARIKRLQARTVAPVTQALGNRAEARAQSARARELDAERAALQDRMSSLERILARLAPLDEAREQARTRLDTLARAAGGPVAGEPFAEVAARAHPAGVERRALRMWVAALTPLFSLAIVVLVILLREVREFRVCASSELAHWLGVPVVAASPWPEREQALEGLVDELFDAAVESVGTTLILPTSEAERPLAHTLSAQLNARAQRHFRSATGARITLAQAWEGELSGTRLRRAAEVADRVLWVVSADHYRGAELAERRSLLGRTGGVAALLVEAEVSRLARSVGPVRSFWATRSESQAAAKSVPPERVPLH